MEELKKLIHDSGLSITHIAEKLGISRTALYAKLNGRVEWKASEIVKISELLHLSVKQRNEIFLS